MVLKITELWAAVSFERQTVRLWHTINWGGHTFNVNLWLLYSYVLVKFVVHILEYLQIAAVVLTSYIFVQNYPSHAIVSDGQTFDFVIVGGGAAGCVVANRLTEVANWSVLLIEAGDDPPYFSEIPGVSVILSATFPDWDYHSINDGFSSQMIKSRKIHTRQGKMLGGSSNVNYMFYVRGNEKDYENWVARGNPGWDWKTVTQYFKKSEHLTDDGLAMGKSSYLHGTKGYLGVTQHTNVWEAEIAPYLKAFEENGHDILEDLNGEKQLGYSVPSYTVSNHKRQSAGLAYIKPVMDRPNLFILKNTLATKIILNKNKRAVGVEIKENGVTKRIFASKEVIVSAGGINSPKLLMLSGIGPTEHLQEIGIKTKVDISNVGNNLQDHILIPFVLSNGNGSSSFTDNLKVIDNLDKFPTASIMGFAALDKNQTSPDYQITAISLPVGSPLSAAMCSKAFEWNDEVCLSIANSTAKDTLFALMSLYQPKSRGTIRLRSKDPEIPPIIATGYFSNRDDLTKLANCIKDFVSVTKTEYSKKMKLDLVDLNIDQCKDISFGSQKYWECYALNLAATQYHYSGTCAMGPKGEGVVDETLRVRGVKGLRIVDASIMPTLVNGNTYAPVVMIAEKASDMIKDDHSTCDLNCSSNIDM